MKTARKVADRIVMIYPLTQLGADDRQIIFEGTPAEIDNVADRRVRQFVRGEAGERLAARQAKERPPVEDHDADHDMDEDTDQDVD